jgi:polysaccharide export outer membrane protein
MSNSRALVFCKFWGLIIGVAILASCNTQKKLREEMKILQGNLDTAGNHEVRSLEATIQKGDILGITVYSDDPQATSIFNQAQIGAGAGATAPGYLVDQDGNIRFQSLGVVHVEGMKKLELIKLLDEKLKVYLVNPYTDIRFLNFRVNVLGEVANPGVITTPEGRLTILELIGMAGDMTTYGRRDNVLVIREKDGKREFGRINLRSPTIFQSPYFNLQQNDVVLIEGNRKRPTGNEQEISRTLSIAGAIAGLLSTVIVIYTLISGN